MEYNKKEVYKGQRFDFEEIVRRKLLEKADHNNFLLYKGYEGAYYFLGFFWRLKKKEAKQLLLSMHRRGLIQMKCRGILILKRSGGELL